MTISWQEGSGSFSNYWVSYSPVGTTSSPVLVARGEDRTLDLTGLAAGAEYTITVHQQGDETDSFQLTQYTCKSHHLSLIEFKCEGSISERSMNFEYEDVFNSYYM